MRRAKEGAGLVLVPVVVALWLIAAAQAADAPRQAAWGTGAAAAPTVSLRANTVEGVELAVSTPGFALSAEQRPEGLFARIELPGSGPAAGVGEPNLPVLRRILVAPLGATVTATASGESQDVALAQLGIDGRLLPRQRPVPKIRGARAKAAFELQGALYQTDAFLPASPVRVAEAGRLSGQRLVMVEIHPVAYNPAKGILRVWPRLTVRVEFGSVPAAAGGKVGAALSARESARLAALAMNFKAGGGAKAPGRLLVISHDSLAGNLAPFVNYKIGLGWTVDVANTTTAGTTTTAIQTYVKARYGNLSTRPDALLLVGDTGQVPCFTGVATDNPDTDLYYACMDAGDDWQPEFPVGRISVTTTTQLDNVLTKTINYGGSGPWTVRATFMASEDLYWLSEATHEWVISNYLDKQGYTSQKLYSHTYSATTAQVSKAFDDGCALGIYSGHGAETQWADGPVFLQSDVNALTNAGMYPFVCSFACLTGCYSVGECFAETWLRGANKGAIAILASSVTSYWDEDDILEKKVFVALFDDGLRAFGDATVKAKQYFLAYYGSSDTTRRYFEMYNLFGDPTASLVAPSMALTIATTSPLPTGYTSQSYSVTLKALGGTAPYTWAVTAGSLPPDLTLDPKTGLLSGKPAAAGTTTFTVTATDAVAATASKPFDLPVAESLQIVTGSPLPGGTLGVPYSVTLNAVGGTPPYAWSEVRSGAYAESNPGSGWIGGGAAQGWQDDDASWPYTLPWPFPFYGVDRTTVNVCSNGFLDFATSDSEYSNSDAGLKSNVRIAPLWDDLTTYSPDDITINATPQYVAFRWVAHTYANYDPVNAEAVLYPNGDIRFNYGAAHTGLTPTIGISAGDGTNYTFSTRNNAASIPANVSFLFAQASKLPPGLSLNSATGAISGTPTKEGTYTFTIRATDSAAPAQSATKDFVLTIGQTLTVSGSVKTPGGKAVAGVAMNGLPGTPTTAADGSYTGGVPFAWSGTVTPTKTGLAFTPASRSYANLAASSSGQDYVEQAGSLQVTLGPAGAVSAGAQWRVDSGTWQASGATVGDLPVGSHTVDYKTVAGWAAPGPDPVTIEDAKTATLSAAYTALPPGLDVQSSNDLDFGAVAVGSSKTLADAYTVKNTGGGTLTVGVSVAPPFHVLDQAGLPVVPPPLTLALTTGQQKTVSFDFAPTAPGSFSQDITFASNAGTVTRKAKGTGFLPTWTLQILAPSGSGTTNPATGSYVYLVGSPSAAVRATEAVGWVFSGWVGDAVPTGHAQDNPITIPSGTMDQTLTLQAVFARAQWTLAIQAPEGSGTTDPIPAYYGYEVGTDSAPVLAKPAAGWLFGHWEGSGVAAGHASDNPIVVPSGTSTQMLTLEAVFVPPWTLAVQPPAGSGTTDPPAGSYTYQLGDPADPVTAKPAAEWTFSGWSGTAVPAGHANDNPITVPSGTQGQAMALKATFVPLTWTLDVQAPEGTGKTSPGTGTYSYSTGKPSAPVQASPGAGMVFLGWAGSAVPPGHAGDNPITVPPASANQTVALKATFGPPVLCVVATDPLAAETRLGETPDPGQFTISRTGGTSAPLAVPFTLGGTAKNGTDYTLSSPSPASIPAGQASTVITVTPKDDQVYKGNRTVILTLGPNPAIGLDPAKKSATVTIADNEPVVRIEAAKADASEAGPTPGTFTVTRSTLAPTPLVVKFAVGGTAVNGTDYIKIATSVTIPANAASATITITPKDDAIFEPKETVVLTLAASTAYGTDPAKKSATVTIADNEAIVSVEPRDPNASEQGPDTGAFTVTAKRPAGASPVAVTLKVPFTVSGTAKNGTDYTLAPASPVTVTIKAGEATGQATVTVTPKPDALAEPPETVVLTIGTSTAYGLDPLKKSATLTITDK